MRLFAIDPSLTAVGWCLAEASKDGLEIEHVGRVIPPKDGDLFGRSRQLVKDVEDVIEDKVLPHDQLPSKLDILVEIPSPRATARHGGGGYGLAPYGFAVGALCMALYDVFGSCVHPIDVKWSGSRTKEARRAIALKHYVHLKRIKDPGYDISDAVAMAVWWHQVGRRKAKTR